MLYLEGKVGGATRHWPLTVGAHTLGRGRECDIVLDEPSISRRHLSIDCAEESVQVEDLESVNGLWVDGRRVKRIRIAPGQWFSTGTQLFTIRRTVTMTDSEPGDRGSQVGAEVRSQGPRPTIPNLGGEPAPSIVGDREARLEALLCALLRDECHPDGLMGTLLRAVVELSGGAGGSVLGYASGGWYIESSCGDPLPASPGEAEGAGSWSELIAMIGQMIQPRSIRIGGIDLYCHPVGIEGKTAALILIHPVAPTQVVAGADVLAEVVHARLGDSRPTVERRDHQPRAVEPFGVANGFLTASETGRVVLGQIDRLAVTTLPVMLVGESGTGKELLAIRLHRHSPRAEWPFIPLNCSALPRDLVEAELFGIQRGVATGVSERTGRFQQASGGTLFLDEIGDLPVELQPKLLRALESGEVLPIGAPRPVKVDVRVVSATHMDLRSTIGAGAFRQDLLFRLAGAELLVPPLRDRPEDILPLARHFAREASEQRRSRFIGLDVEAAKLLLGYAWPGNVRELRHLIERAVALSDGPILQESHLPPVIRGQSDRLLGDALLGLREDYPTAVERFSRLYFSQLLERWGKNMSDAARKAGLGRSTLYAKIQELGLRSPNGAHEEDRRDSDS